MNKREISQKFDEIVAFAEIDKFIDTPVKHYSSGMYVRLAFSVAAHLEPEILLVDEVLAVGDINFQKKCLGKMGEVAQAGRTVVLVSHQMNQMRRLCHRVVWIDKGCIRVAGPAHEVVSTYETAMARGERSFTSINDSKQIAPGTRGRFLRWEICSRRSGEPHLLQDLDPVTVKFTVEVYQPIKRGHHGIALFNHDRQLIWANGVDNLELQAGEHELRHAFPMLPLRPGPYFWHVSLYNEGEEVDNWECLPEMVVATEIHQHPSDQWNGIMNLPSRFELADRG
jgi:lipopolysaccharide transport system ATP-binding protein